MQITEIKLILYQSKCFTYKNYLKNIINVKMIKFSICKDVMNKKVILHASEHFFNLNYTEILMLRNYSYKNNYLFSSMMGGSESIRDIQEARNLDVDVFEFPLVESLFSLKKIFSALERVFLDNIEVLSSKYLFINLSTYQSINEILKDIKKIKIPSFLSESNIIFNFDRKMLVRSKNKLTNNSFEVFHYEKELNLKIFKIIEDLKNSNFLFCISGGIINESLKNFLNFKIQPNFIKTGLFSCPLRSNITFKDYSKIILNYQSTEAKLLNLMRTSLNNKHNYLEHRQFHMMNYIIESLAE